jgi:hypothetical protein
VHVLSFVVENSLCGWSQGGRCKVQGPPPPRFPPQEKTKSSGPYILTGQNLRPAEPRG